MLGCVWKGPWVGAEVASGGQPGTVMLATGGVICEGSRELS